MFKSFLKIHIPCTYLGIDWSQLSRLRSESLKSDWLKTLVNFILDMPEKEIVRIIPGWEPHHDRIGFRVSAWTWSATRSRHSYGPQISRIWHWDAPGPRASKDRGPSDPRGVPWDQNFCLKIFLLSWKYVILCTFHIYYAKIGLYLVIWGFFP